MTEVASNTARLAISGPPFTNQPDGRTLDKCEYLAFLRVVLAEVQRILVNDGVLVLINTDLRDHARYNGGRPGYDGLVWYKHADLRLVAEDLGLRCFDVRVWVKGLKRNPYRYNFSYLQFFQKGTRRRLESQAAAVRAVFDPHVWLLEGGTIRTLPDGTRFRDAVHPEVVERCIARFTQPGDCVINPFAGSGTVLGVACLMDRRAVGYEINRRLSPLLERSIDAYRADELYQRIAARYPRVPAGADLRNATGPSP
jgi:DNA modification methylase